MASTYARNRTAIQRGAHTVCPGGCVPAATCQACNRPHGVCAGCGWCYQCTAYTATPNPGAVWGNTPMVRTTSGALVPAPACGHTSRAARTPNGACAICTTAAIAQAAATHPATCACGYCPFRQPQA